MKKFLTVVDPRRSRSRVTLSNTDGGSITLSGSDDVFGVSQFSQALKAAATLSAKENRRVKVNIYRN